MGGFSGGAISDFSLIVREGAVANDDAVRDAKEFAVGELFAWAKIAVIEEKQVGVFIVKFFGDFVPFFANTNEIIAERSNVFWPD